MIAGQYVIREDGSRWLLLSVRNTVVGDMSPAVIYYLEGEDGKLAFVRQYSDRDAQIWGLVPCEKIRVEEGT